MRFDVEEASYVRTLGFSFLLNLVLVVGLNVFASMFVIDGTLSSTVLILYLIGAVCIIPIYALGLALLTPPLSFRETLISAIILYGCSFSFTDSSVVFICWSQ